MSSWNKRPCMYVVRSEVYTVDHYSIIPVPIHVALGSRSASVVLTWIRWSRTCPPKNETFCATSRRGPVHRNGVQELSNAITERKYRLSDLSPIVQTNSIRLPTFALREGGGTDQPILSEPTSEPRNPAEKRRLPPVGCTCCWAHVGTHWLLCVDTWIVRMRLITPLPEWRLLFDTSLIHYCAHEHASINYGKTRVVPQSAQNRIWKANGSRDHPQKVMRSTGRRVCVTSSWFWNGRAIPGKKNSQAGQRFKGAKNK